VSFSPDNFLPQFQNPGISSPNDPALWVFLPERPDTLGMPQPPRTRLRKVVVPGSIVCAVVLALGTAQSLLADTSTRLRSSPPGSCYCCCGESRVAAGCVKICELPKYASRWWASTCAKPHVHRPAQDSNAGPHLRRPDRATYARLSAKDR